MQIPQTIPFTLQRTISQIPRTIPFVIQPYDADTATGEFSYTGYAESSWTPKASALLVYTLAGSGTGKTTYSGAVTRTVTYTYTGSAVGASQVVSSVIPQTIPFTVGSFVLATPEGLTATQVLSTSIDLSWSAVVGATGYEVERNGTVIATGLAVTSYTDTNLNPNTLYTYRVRATAE